MPSASSGTARHARNVRRQARARTGRPTSSSSPVEHERLPVADELVDVARLARRRAPQELLDALAGGADAEEEGMDRVGRPEQRRVGAGHRRAPSGRPARGLGEVLAEGELRQGGDLGSSAVVAVRGLDRLVVLGLFGFVRHASPSPEARPDGLTWLEARDGRLQVLVDLEHGVELGHLEELADLRPGVEELGLAALLLGVASARGPGRRGPSCRGSPTAERSTSRLTRPSSSRRVIGPLEGRLGLADDEVPADRQDRDVAVFAGRQFHESGRIMSKTRLRNRGGDLGRPSGAPAPRRGHPGAGSPGGRPGFAYARSSIARHDDRLAGALLALSAASLPHARLGPRSTSRRPARPDRRQDRRASA